MKSPLRFVSTLMAAAMFCIVSEDAATEARLQELGAKGPRLTPGDVDRVIVKSEYARMGATTTVCCLTLVNGFTVVGMSACVSPENFDEGLGREIAFKKARDQVWQLEAYLLAQHIDAARLQAAI